eukprot:159358_1
MSTQICLIVEVGAIKKKVKINQDEDRLQQLKQKIIAKFRNIKFDREFNIIDDDECVIDDDDIEDFENKTKLYIKFLSADFDDIKEDFDDLDDGDQEVQVNDDDLREKALGSSIK